MIIKSPFDVINILGTAKFDEVANIDKKRHFFIINRMLSRSMPEIAMNLSTQQINPESAIDFWHLAFKELNKSSQGKGTLRFIRSTLRVSMAGAKKKAAKKKIDKDLANKYMQLAKISPKEFDIIKRFHEKDLIKYLKEVSKMLKTVD